MGKLYFSVAMDPTKRQIQSNRFKRYFSFYSLFGQNLYSTKKLRKQRALSYIPSILSLCVIVSCEAFLSCKRYGGVKSEHVSVLYSLMMMNMFPSLVAAVESFRMPKGTRQFVRIFNAVIENLETRTTTKIAWKKFKRQISWRFSIVLGCYVISFVFRLVFPSPTYGRWYELWYTILWFFRTTTILHIIFYVDLLNILLSSVASSVEIQRKLSSGQFNFRPKNVIPIVNRIKFHHFQIWECFQVINKYFGNILIASTIDSTYTVTNTGYCVFFLWMEGHDILIIFRKYSLNQFNFISFHFFSSSKFIEHKVYLI